MDIVLGYHLVDIVLGYHLVVIHLEDVHHKWPFFWTKLQIFCYKYQEYLHYSQDFHKNSFCQKLGKFDHLGKYKIHPN